MNIIHFDVDEQLDKVLEGEKYSYSLQDIPEDSDFSQVQIITIKSNSRATNAILVNFPKLKLLITRTVGTDHIDLVYCKKKEIAVYHVMDYGSFNIAEHTFALLLAGARNIIHAQSEIRQGKFSYKQFLGFSLKGKTLGVVGTGRIGLEVIQRAVGFEMEVVAYDVYQNEKAAQKLGFCYVSLEELAQKSDVITLHAPLMDSTYHMINEDIISKLKEGVILINTARGGLIDTDVLAKYADKFRFIGLDVLEEEASFSKDHPLLSNENVIITPHIAFFSDASVKKIAEETMKMVENYLSGKEEGRVV